MDAALVSVNDLPTEAKAYAGTVLFGRKERNENLLELVGVDAAAVVFDGNVHPAVSRFKAPGNERGVASI